MISRLSVVAALAALAAGPTTAQDDTARLDRAIQRMRQLDAVSFETFEESNSALSRRFRGMMPAGMNETEVSGGSATGLVFATLNDGDDEIVIHGGRMLARKDGEDWRPRRGVLTDGGQLPFIFDARAFFDILASIGADARTVVRSEPVKWRDKELVLYSVTIEKDAANDLVLGGGLPNVGGGGGGAIVMIGGMGGGMPRSAPETTVDLAIYVDPATSLVHRVKSRAYQKSNMPQNVRLQIQGAGAGGFDEDEEEVVELDEDGNRIYKHGLPIRKLEDGVSLSSFEARMTDHGESHAPDLDDREKRMLGIRRGV